MKDKIKITVDALKLYEGKFYGGFTSLTIQQMSKINGTLSNSGCQNSDCTSGNNTSCSNTFDCRGSSNKNCTNSAGVCIISVPK